MAVVILGGGFGLYGYLPALLEGPEGTVLLPERYRDRVAGRPELAPLLPRITWHPTEADALAAATILVMARRPEDQLALPDLLARHSNLHTLVLEKPLAPTPAQADALAQAVTASGRVLRVGYTMAHTDWGRALGNRLAAPAAPHTVTVAWRFRAHHLVHGRPTWKQHAAQGGGVLRFYGIHLLALLARGDTPCWTVQESLLHGGHPDEPTRWRARLVGGQGTVAELLVDMDAPSSRCAVRVDGALLWDAPSPFAEPPAGGRDDARVPVLARLLAAAVPPDDLAWTRRVHALWAQAEAVAASSGVTAGGGGCHAATPTSEARVVEGAASR